MPNRYLCDVLEEMRKMYETRNFAGLLGVIEDAQRLADRMEAALRDQRDFKYYEDEARSAKEKSKKAKSETKDLEEVVTRLKEDIENLKKVKHGLMKETRGGREASMPDEGQRLPDKRCEACGNLIQRCICQL